MKIKHKYLRNRAFHNKHWNRIRSKEHPFETYCPYGPYGIQGCSSDEQVKRHFEWINTRVRAIESGQHRSFWHAPKHFRQDLWNVRKAQERKILSRIRQGDYDAEMPTFKKDADWLWF